MYLRKLETTIPDSVGVMEARLPNQPTESAPGPAEPWYPNAPASVNLSDGGGSGMSMGGETILRYEYRTASSRFIRLSYRSLFTVVL